MPTRNQKYKLYASKHTKELSRLITSTNFAWNHIVAFARRYYHVFRKTVTPAQLQHHMAKLSKRDPFWSKLHSQSMQEICQRYSRALDDHFKIKGRGFPRPHKKHVGGSVLFKGNGGYSLDIDGNTGIFVVNKLGKNWHFKFKVTRPWSNVKNAIVKRYNDGCLYLILTCDVPEQHLKSEGGSIGMDFGMKTFLTLSDGSTVQIPDYHKQALDETRAADRSYSFKRNAKVYGTSFKRAKKKKQKAHRKVANKRSDFHWKLAHNLCRQYAFIAIEDLNIAGMKKHKRWGRKISSLGYGEFVQKLKVVASKYGTVIVEIDRFAPSSQLCSECCYQWTGTKDLTVREWVCPNCGAIHDRDVNAAKNILRLARELYINGEGVPRAGSDCKTRKGNTTSSRSCRSKHAPESAKNLTTYPFGCHV